MKKKASVTQKVSVRKDLFKRLRALGQLDARDGQYMVNRACEELLERAEQQAETTAAK